MLATKTRNVSSGTAAVTIKKLPGDVVALEDVRMLGPIVENQCERTKALSTKRRSHIGLARIKRANLDIENGNLRVRGAHFIAGKPAKLFDETDPAWAPSLLLGYEQRHEHGSLTTQTPRKTTRRKAASGRRKAGSRIAGTVCRGRCGNDSDPAVCQLAPLATPD
ncbi:hypothetical protein HPB49_006583 [Dermacentor silvarum]|uniref:Uncharacterized protein n=1 Tax=Dermacentor silvarum TaxID=543639 RepID=A0ACB8DBF4_DERSI|nr:hypothetical protein HPB49_006583 [Dermacentor silvarum]